MTSTITIAGQAVHYEDTGAGGAIVLLHGWGADHTLFQPLAQLLARKYRVLALDFPGFGQSPEPASPCGVGDYADLVLGFLAALGIEGCSLLGHSFGGRVVIKLAARQLPVPKLHKLVLVAAAGIKPAQSKKARARAKRYQIGRKLLKPFPQLAEAWRNRHGSADYRAASPMMREVFKNTVNEDLRGLLPRIQPPTLLVWGRGDTETPLADGQLMEREIPGAGLVVLENCGHYAFLEQQGQFLRVMASFFSIEI